jgi:hypothetical protein
MGRRTAVVGLILLGSAIKHYAHEMRLVVPGATLVARGFQTILSAFLISFLDLDHR